jgi:hypothetical protein
MIWLLLALAIALNIAALVSIAAWYRRDRADLLDDLAGARADALDARADLLEARTDLDMETEAHKHALVKLARAERKAADDRVLATVEAFRRNLDEHDAAYVCLPTLDGIRAASVGMPVPPTPVELREPSARLRALRSSGGQR